MSHCVSSLRTTKSPHWAQRPQCLVELRCHHHVQSRIPNSPSRPHMTRVGLPRRDIGLLLWFIYSSSGSSFTTGSFFTPCSSSSVCSMPSSSSDSLCKTFSHCSYAATICCSIQSLSSSFVGRLFLSASLSIRAFFLDRLCVLEKLFNIFCLFQGGWWHVLCVHGLVHSNCFVRVPDIVVWGVRKNEMETSSMKLTHARLKEKLLAETVGLGDESVSL